MKSRLYSREQLNQETITLPEEVGLGRPLTVKMTDKMNRTLSKYLQKIEDLESLPSNSNPNQLEREIQSYENQLTRLILAWDEYLL